MVSSDTLGYPIKKHFYRLHLESAWRAAFGALDMGDFETFLKESADRTYPDALAQIRKMGAGRSEISQIKEAQEYEAQGGIEQYRMVADGLRQEGKEYEASAIEALIADLVAAQGKAKTQRKPAEKREPKQKPLESVPEKPQTITKPGISAFEFGADFKRIKDMIIKDGEKNLQDAKALIAAKETKLTDADRFELSEMLTTAEQGFTPMKAPERIHKPQKMKPEISTTRTRARRKKKEEGDENEEEEQVPTVRRYSFNNLSDANEFFKENKSSIHEMIRIGVPEWIETRKKAAVGQLSTSAVFALGNALEYAMIPTRKAEARALIAMDVIHKNKWLIVEHGLEFATKDFDWQRQIGFYSSLKIDTEQLKKDVFQAVMKLEFSFGKR